jgi:hypothetical protein
MGDRRDVEFGFELPLPLLAEGQLGGFSDVGVIQQYHGFFGPGSRVPVSIGGGIWGWHIEPVTGQPDEFTTHFDMGDPNWDLAGIAVHSGGDGLVGFLFHHHDAGLDPRCSP